MRRACHGAGTVRGGAPTSARSTGVKAGEDSRTSDLSGRAAYACSLDYLNAMVHKKTTQAYEGGGHKLDPQEHPEHRCYQKVREGELIYPHRSRAILYTCWALVLMGFYRSPSLAFTLGAVAFTSPFIDLYGGVLHVVLDEPTFIDYPIIGRGCLEFQWHHILPYDLAVRSIPDVTGDLNQIVPLIWCGLAALYRGFPDGRVMTVVAAAVGNAYLGIFSHQQAHKMARDRPQWVTWLQQYGLLVSPDLHREHHRFYQDGFSILNGISSPLLTWAFHAIPNKHLWLLLLASLTCFMFPPMIDAYVYLFPRLSSPLHWW